MSGIPRRDGSSTLIRRCVCVCVSMCVDTRMEHASQSYEWMNEREREVHTHWRLTSTPVENEEHGIDVRIWKMCGREHGRRFVPVPVVSAFGTIAIRPKHVLLADHTCTYIHRTQLATFGRSTSNFLPQLNPYPLSLAFKFHLDSFRIGNERTNKQ